MAIKIQETYSSGVVNKTVISTIDGVNYTKFYTELNTELTIGDYVYILNGNYDNSDIIDKNEYQGGSNGYKILEIDKNSITLDIAWRNENPWNEDEFQDYTKVYVVSDSDKFNYENIDNNFGFNIFAGDKYSEENNNIFLSQIENLPYTTETETKDKFFKSLLQNEPDLLLNNSRGQLFNDSTTLKYQVAEYDVHGATYGASGSTASRFSSNLVKDFAFYQYDLGPDQIYSLVSDSVTGSNTKFSLFDKTTFDISEVTLQDSKGFDTESHMIRPFLSSSSIVVQYPKHLIGGNYLYNSYGVTTSQIRLGINEPPIEGVITLNNTAVVGYSDNIPAYNHKGFGFYSESDTTEVPNPDNGATWSGVGTSSGFDSGTFSTPFHVLSATAGSLSPTYSENTQYFPLDNVGTTYFVPPYAGYNGIGRPVAIEINQWVNNDNSEVALECAFAGDGRFNTTDNSVDFDGRVHGGIYFYSYTGNWKDYFGVFGDNLFLGNAFDLSKTTFDNYGPGGDWESILPHFNPFQEYLEYPFNHIKDIKFIGIEQKELGMNLGYQPGSGGSIIEYRPGIESGIYYSKYLVILEEGTVFYVYINMDSELLAYNTEFLNQLMTIPNLPQIHIFIEEVDASVTPTVIGQNRKNEVLTFPAILDGEYPIGSIDASSPLLEFGINGFDTVSWEVTSETSLDFSTDRWVVSTSTYSPRLDYLLVSGISGGIYVYDKSVGGVENIYNITSTFSFDIGDSLPTDNIFKVISEMITDGDGNDLRRIWAATDQGLFMFDYGFSFNYDYYYSIDFDNNVIPLEKELFKNNKLYIMEDFRYDGIDYNKNSIYRWNRTQKRWDIDTTYLPAYLTKAHFKDGTFLNDSTMDDGIFGNRDTEAQWTGGEWRNGIFYNSVWDSGVMSSKSDDLIGQSYYAKLVRNNVRLTTDFTNNSSYGYNLSIDSYISEGTLNNGNFVNTQVGTGSSDSLLNLEYSGSSFSYTDLTVNKGYFLRSDIKSTIINNSKLEFTNFEKSKIKDNSKIINSGGEDSIISDAQIENKGKIKITGYEKWYNIKNSLTNQDIIQIHKFFISESDFNELDFEDWVIFNSIKIDNTSPTNILDKLFYILGGAEGYYNDIYQNLNKIDLTSGDSKYAEYPFKVFISKKLKSQNSNRSYISFNGTKLVVTTATNQNPQYSIDLNIVIDSIDYNSASSEYQKALENDGILKITPLDISNSTVQTRHFKHCWINGGEWVNGSMINPDQLSNLLDNGDISTYDTGSTMSVLFNLNTEGREIKPYDIFATGSIFYTNIWNTSYSTYTGGNFNYNSGTSSVVLIPYTPIGLTNSTTLVPALNQFTHLNLNRIDGTGSTLTIKGGLFKNQYFANTTFDNDVSLTDTSYDNVRMLTIINTEITDRDTNDINKGFFSNGHFVGIDNSLSSTTISNQQTFYNTTVESGTVNKSAFISGTFSDGQFTNNKYLRNDDIIPISNNLYVTNNKGLLPIWHGGTFEKGTFNDSVWLDGVFINGTMKNSQFLSGTFSNGRFGDRSTKSTLSLFRKGTWEDGTFENGIFGDSSDHISDINSIYGSSSYIGSNYYIKDGTNIWKDGNFNNGVFTTIDDNVSVWEDGKFNNGQVIGSVIWLNGIFNNGKFKSTYGREVASVWGEADLLTAASASNTDSRAVNLKNYYSGSLDFLDRYNIGSIRDKDSGNTFNNPGTLVLDTSDYQLKYGYVSNTVTSLLDPFSQRNSSHGYSEQEVNNFFDNPASTNLNLQFRKMNYIQDNNNNRRNPLYDSNVLGAKINIQDTGTDFVYDGTQYVTASNFLVSSMNGISLTFSSIYAWRGGVFNGGEFGDPLNTSNANPSWEDGIFNGGKFYGKRWKDGKFIKGDFIGTGLSQSQDNLTNIHEGYNPQALVESYIDDFSAIQIATVSTAQDGYKNILDNYNWFGLWLDGRVSGNINEFDSASKISENILIDYFNEDKYNRAPQRNARFKNMLWASGTFDNNVGIFEESAFLSGTFSNGQFLDSMFNPYVQRWDFESGNIGNIKFTFELDEDKAIWKNGVFTRGVFYYSDWNNGLFEYGTMVGGLFKKGTVNYMSGFSNIWKDGRWRNGNWYGSNFTINNAYNNNSVPNPFEYLGEYFIDTEYAPFITDLLGNNQKRTQDDRLHIWNLLGGTQSISNYLLSTNGHGFGSDTSQFTEPFGLQIQKSNVVLSTDVSNSGLISMTSSVSFVTLIPLSLPMKYSSSFTYNVADTARLQEGSYRIKFYTNSITEVWQKHSSLNTLTFKLKADVFDDNQILVQANKILKTITTSYSTNITTTFVVPNNWEYRLKVDIKANVILPSTGFPADMPFFMQVDQSISGIKYLSDNNTLNGYLGMSWSGEYLNSDIMTVSATVSYTNEIGISQEITYCNYDYTTISVPSDYTNADGAYTQFGNGTFQKGIWENGVWNNGYRGTEFGTYIEDTDTTSGVGIFTYSLGNTASVEMNPLYIDTPKAKYRTEPIAYFNIVQRSFKTNKNTWRFVLESAFDIDGTTQDTYNRFILGDKVSVGNIIGLDINGNRKLIKDIFTVVNIPNNNQITLEYKETFPIDSIQIDSDRHLIYVTKNIFLSGAYLNGIFEGVMNSGYIKGNREITKLVDSHLVDVRFEGGHLQGVKYSLTNAFDNKTSNAQSLSPNFSLKYNDLYHSTLVQKMSFSDEVSMSYFSQIVADDLTIEGDPILRDKYITFSSTASLLFNSIQYLYNSDIDVVYEPEYFSTIFDQNIFNSHVVNKTKIGGSVVYNTEFGNIGAGNCSFDILNSESKFSYSINPNEIDKKTFNLSLGSKYKKFNELSNVDFNQNEEFNTPSAFNPIDSASYGLYAKPYYQGNGVTFESPQSVSIHENFFYTFGLTNSIISMDNENVNTDRYQMIEVVTEFKDNEKYLNPWSPISNTSTFDATYSYGLDQIPKLSIGQNYNEQYGTSSNYISYYDNNVIPFIEGTKEGESNRFGSPESDKYTMRTYIYNNITNRDNVKIVEQGFNSDIGATSGNYTVNSPVYHSIKSYEIDSIPFFNYRNFNCPISGTISSWNVQYKNTVNSYKVRGIDSRVRVPFFATSVPINYSDDSFDLSNSTNFFGGTNILGNSVIDFSIFDTANYTFINMESGGEAS